VAEEKLLSSQTMDKKKIQPIIYTYLDKKGVAYKIRASTDAVRDGEQFTLFTTVEDNALHTYFLTGEGDLTLTFMSSKDCHKVHMFVDGKLCVPGNTAENHFDCVAYWCASALRLKHTNSDEGFRYFDKGLFASLTGF